MKPIFDRAAITIVMGGFLAMAGCAGHPAPDAKVATSTAAIRAAEESGAKDVPQAALHLKLAQDQLQAGKNLISEDKNERAEYVLSRAQADAELAIALSNSAESKEEAGKALNEVKAVRGGQVPSTVNP